MSSFVTFKDCYLKFFPHPLFLICHLQKLASLLFLLPCLSSFVTLRSLAAWPFLSTAPSLAIPRIQNTTWYNTKTHFKIQYNTMYYEIQYNTKYITIQNAPQYKTQQYTKHSWPFLPSPLLVSHGRIEPPLSENTWQHPCHILWYIHVLWYTKCN